MANLGRRRGDGVTFKRGNGTVNEELLTIQLCLEALHPEVIDQAARIDDLESSRDKAYGMLKVVVVLQSIMLIAFASLFAWGLNHMTFHSDWERPQHSESAPHNADLPTQYQPR